MLRSLLRFFRPKPFPPAALPEWQADRSRAFDRVEGRLTRMETMLDEALEQVAKNQAAENRV